jgi:hypothetical protein
VRRDVAEGFRGAAATVRQAWWNSDPAFWELSRPRSLDAQRLAREEECAADRMLHRRRTIAAGFIVYEGRIRVRPGSGRVVLADADGRPGLDHWLVRELGLDGYGGDDDVVRITVQPHESTHPHPGATGR